MYNAIFCILLVKPANGRENETQFLTVIYLGIIGLSTRYGTGLPESEQKPEWLEPAWKCVLAIEVVYYMIVYCIKCSILLFYLRLGNSSISPEGSTEYG